MVNLRQPWNRLTYEQPSLQFPCCGTFDADKRHYLCLLLEAAGEGGQRDYWYLLTNYTKAMGTNLDSSGGPTTSVSSTPGPGAAGPGQSFVSSPSPVSNYSFLPDLANRQPPPYNSSSNYHTGLCPALLKSAPDQCEDLLELWCPSVPPAQNPLGLQLGPPQNPILRGLPQDQIPQSLDNPQFLDQAFLSSPVPSHIGGCDGMYLLQQFPDPTHEGDPQIVHTPFSRADLMNFANMFPKMRSDPQDFQSKLRQYFALYNPILPRYRIPTDRSFNRTREIGPLSKSTRAKSTKSLA